MWKSKADYSRHNNYILYCKKLQWMGSDSFDKHEPYCFKNLCSMAIFLLFVLFRYMDLSVRGKALTTSPLTEKLLQYKACLRFYDTVDHSYTNASIESIL